MGKSGKQTADSGDDVDALFRLPLAEFTGARNAVAAQLKKDGRADEAARVKSLAKPSVSAWAVNQLYWNHRDVFDHLIASGERFHKAQKSGKVADMRAAIDARREVLSQLSDLATSLLRDAGHNPSPDSIHRITTTLEGVSAYASRSDGPHLGRLTHDVDPPGFESFGSFVPATTKQEASGKKQAISGVRQAAEGRRHAAVGGKQESQIEQTGKSKIAEAKVSLQGAKRLLTQAQTRARSLEAAQKKAEAEAKQADKRRRDAEERLEKAKAASEDAARRARSVAVEVEEAASAMEDAERTVEDASKELEAISSGGKA